ncbi:MAG TPA: hypothetical protein PLJ21_07885, partial [Pseudobdellovibrionaceae bacterium]|nr:hypothetical protein [Pseudobdellovibrionaceae bacterium]
ETDGKLLKDNFLSLNQEFPLNVMKAEKYIDDKIKMQQLGLSENLHPNQVTFFEVTSPYSENELLQLFGNIPPIARKEPQSLAIEHYFSQYDGFENNRYSGSYDLKIGTLWLISGQYKKRQFKLPMESSNPKIISRKTYKWIWEIGRAAQTEPSAFQSALKASMSTILSELFSSGGRIEEAFLFAHSLDKVHTELYKRKYGFKVFLEVSGGLTNEGFLFVPLSIILNRLHMKSSYEDFDIDFSFYKWLQVQSQILSNPVLISKDIQIQIQIRDFSSLKVFLLNHLLNQKNPKLLQSFSEEGREDLLNSVRSPPYPVSYDPLKLYARATAQIQGTMISYGGADRIYYSDPFEDLNPNEYLKKYRLIEVIIPKDFKLPAEVALKSVFEFYKAKFKKLGLDDFSSFLKNNNIYFAISTQAPFNTTKLEFEKKWYAHRPALYSYQNSAFFSYKHKVVPELYIEITSFSSIEIQNAKIKYIPLEDSGILPSPFVF